MKGKPDLDKEAAARAKAFKKERKRVRRKLSEQGYDYFPILVCEGKAVNKECLGQIEIALMQSKMRDTKQANAHTAARLKEAGWGMLENPHKPGKTAILCSNCITIFRAQKSEHVKEVEEKRKEDASKFLGGKKVAEEIMYSAKDGREVKADLARDFELALEEWKRHRKVCPSCSKVVSESLDDCAKICAGAQACKREQEMLKRMLNRS